MTDYPVLQHVVRAGNGSGGSDYWGGYSDPQPIEYTVWVQFDEALDIELLSDLSGLPEDSWLRYELDSMGTDVLVDIPFLRVRENEVLEASIGAFQAMHDLGVFPNQPFAVRLGATYSKSWTDCGYEYDVEIDREIVARAPAPSQEQVLAFYETWLQDYARFVEERTAEIRALRERQRSDVSAMFTKSDVYWTGPYSDGYPPDGVLVCLCTRHGGHAYLAEGRSDRGNWDEAWAGLRASVAARYPHVDVDALPRRSPW